MPYSQDPPPDFVSELGMRVGLCHVQLLYMVYQYVRMKVTS